jgi:hypothetical protein
VGNRSLFAGLTVLKAAPSKGKNEGGFDAKLAISWVVREKIKRIDFNDRTALVAQVIKTSLPGSAASTRETLKGDL